MQLFQDLREFSKLFFFFSLSNSLGKGRVGLACTNMGIVLTFGVLVVIFVVEFVVP